MSNEIPISEIFTSIQGEGIHAGKITLFVRVAGCNLAMSLPEGYGSPCNYCDTSYAWLPEQASKTMIIDDLAILIIHSKVKDVCITGGEPLMYSTELYKLLTMIVGFNKTVVIETNGSFPLIGLPARDKIYWSLDIKTPSSGNAEYNCFDNLKSLTYSDQVKFVIGDWKDFEYVLDVLRHYSELKIMPVIFQPVWNKLAIKTLAYWMLSASELPTNVRLGNQLHKMIWPAANRELEYYYEII